MVDQNKSQARKTQTCEPKVCEPVFKAVFGKSWDSLPPVMLKHYANRANCNDTSIAEGTLSIMSKPPLTWMSGLMHKLGQIPIRNVDAVPVTVSFRSTDASVGFVLDRTFNFSQTGAYTFYSQMLPLGGSEVIEIMRFGLGWRTNISWNGKKVILEHRGYALHIAGITIPIPLGLLLGRGYAEEIPVDDETFDMQTHITHPWWGKIYEYKGRFKMKALVSHD